MSFLELATFAVANMSFMCPSFVRFLSSNIILMTVTVPKCAIVSPAYKDMYVARVFDFELIPRGHLAIDPVVISWISYYYIGLVRS